MGRLGFNIAPKKEADGMQKSDGAAQADSVEKGLPDQQNESNETLEMSELVLIIDERNTTIKNLRLLLASLSIVIICLTAYVCLTQARYLHNDQDVAQHINKMQEYTLHMQNLQGQFEAASAAKLEQAFNCSQELSLAQVGRTKLKLEAEAQKAERAREREQAAAEYGALRKSLDSLQQEREAGDKRCAAREDELKAELKQLREERTALVAKNEEAAKKLQEQQQRSASHKRAAAAATSTTTTTTTTPAPRRGLFDSSQFRKFNDLVKEIESVGRVVGNVFSDMF